VLALEQATTLPYLTQRLAREGARVIRIEIPGRGDPNRYVGSDILGEQGMGSYFLPNNCGKQAITLNLAHPDGRALLKRLIADLPAADGERRGADIFATNSRPSSYRKLGIDYGELRSYRRELVWLGITGYGPDCDDPAYDPVVQAKVGWMDLTGESNGPPLVFGLPMVDLGAAEHAYGAVMKALYRRAMTGDGERIDLSLSGSALSWMVSPVALTALGEAITRRGNTHQFFAPVSVYSTRDGYAYVAVGNDRQWEALTGLPGFEKLAEPEYGRNAGRIADVDRLNSRLAAAAAGWRTDDLIGSLQTAGVPAAKVSQLAEVVGSLSNSQATARARDPKTGVELLLPPLPVVSEPGLAELAFPPRLGEHNEAIFGKGLGLSRTELSQLQSQGVI
jgi:formyl-CoA transferase